MKKKYMAIYSTFPDFASASACARMLLTEQLVACVNCIPKIHSFYMWDDDMVDSSEVVMIAKTNNEQIEASFERIKQLHPYESPCILSLPIDHLDEKYASWVNDNLKK